MSYRSLPGLVSVAAALLLVACGGSEPRVARRVAVLPFENLSGDGGWDWLGTAAPRAIARQITDSGSSYAAAVASARDAALVRANRWIFGYFWRQGSELRLAATVMDPDSGKTLDHLIARGPESAGPIGLLDAVARGLEPQSRPIPTRNTDAFRLFEQALASSTPADFEGRIKASTDADPDFGAAYLAWAQRLATTGQADAARRILDRAQSRGDRMDEVSRARLALLDATIRNEPDKRRQSLDRLAKLVPTDSQLQAALAESEVAARRFSNAADLFQRAVAVDPSNVALWNSLGYAQAWARDWEGSVRSLSEYARLAPGDPNAEDSLGEVLFHAGRFAEAETHFQVAFQKTPRFLNGATLAKAAEARLLEGDLDKAIEMFSSFVENRRKLGDATADYRLAQWEHRTGRWKEGVARLEKMSASSSGAARSMAELQLAAWSLEEGNRDEARRHAGEAGRSATGAQGRAQSRVFEILADDPAAADVWRGRFEKALPGAPGGLDSLVSFGLLVSGRFTEAVEPLRRVLSRTPAASDGLARTLLAWAYVESGKTREAGDLIDIWPAPESHSEIKVDWLEFPRSVYLRGVVAEARGDQAQARRYYELFVKLAGARYPLETGKARQKLSR